MLHWRLCSPLTRALLVIALVGIVAEVVLIAVGASSPLLIGGVLLVVVVAWTLRRRDLAHAIDAQLRREADEDEAASRQGERDRPDS